jgi:outer membrane lipoprotein carrier protein
MKRTLPFPHFLLFAVIALLGLVNVKPALANEEPTMPLEIAVNLSEHLGQLSSLSFTFTQQTMDQISGRTKQASGHAYFVKNQNNTRMRWNYQAPDRQVIISDGKELVMYFENLNQMIIAPADTLQQDVTYSFFTGAKNIEDEFIVSEGGEIVEGSLDSPLYDVIRLEPRSTESQVQNIRLWIMALKHIQRIEIVDNFETKTIINISNIEENSITGEDVPQLKDLFSFTPPPGTEIIRQ